jgi:hypothetical protein
MDINVYVKKIEKYKKKSYLLLKNKTGGFQKDREIYIGIIIDTAKVEDLHFLSSGVMGSLYVKKGMPGNVIKFRKHERESKSKLININDNTTPSRIEWLNYDTEDKNITKTIDDYINDLEYDQNYKYILKNTIIKYLDLNHVLKNLDAFLAPRIITIFNNIQNLSDSVNSGHAIGVSFQKLNNVLDESIMDVPKDNLKTLIADFCKLNEQFYTHGDIQNTCRNIVSYMDVKDKIRKLKVIDTESIKPIFVNDVHNALEYINLKHIKNIFVDFASLVECLYINNLINDEVKYDMLLNDYISFILSIPIENYYIVDTTIYDSSNNYPKINILFSTRWENNTIEGTFIKNGNTYIVKIILNNINDISIEYSDEYSDKKSLYHININITNEIKQKIINFLRYKYTKLLQAF